MAERSTHVAQELRNVMATLGPTASISNTRGAGTRARKRESNTISEPERAARRQRCGELVARLHAGGLKLRQAGLQLSEALIGPGTVFMENGEAYTVGEQQGDDGSWPCTLKSRGSQKK